jgi:ABC-type multidrug transport system ATPase subunit
VGVAEAAVEVPHGQTRPAASAGTPPPLELRGVLKSWPSQPEPVLDGVDLTLPPATVSSIAGRNGAGKTTLLRIAGGLIMPESGTVAVSGVDPERDPTEFQRLTGFVAAGNSGLYARLKVEHHLELWARLALLPRRRRTAAVEWALDRFELGPLCGRRVDRLSMGQRQRLRLALGFMHEPTLVLLDEPGTSLDGEGIALLQRALDGLKERGGAALVCLPSGWEPILSIDRTLALTGGRLVDA